VRECSCDNVLDVSSYCFTQIHPFVLFFLQTLKAMSQHGFDISTMFQALEEDHQAEWIDSEYEEYADEYDEDKICVCVAALLLILETSSFCLVN
jgi:hypothetical protein